MDVMLEENVAHLLRAAAMGDAEAQSSLVDCAFDQIRAGNVCFDHGVRAAEIFARMAAVHGKRDDRVKLASVLMYCAQLLADMGEHQNAISYQAESLAVLNWLADEGDEEAASWVQSIPPMLDPMATVVAAEIIRNHGKEPA